MYNLVETDTEVLLEATEFFSLDAISKFNVMFALRYDCKNRALLARDVMDKSHYIIQL